MYLEDTIEIAGETVRKQRFGLANSYDANRTFTGDVLFTTQKLNDFQKSIEEKFEDTAQVDGLTVWKSNGEVPFADMLLDFVQIGRITFEQAEFSLLQKQKDEKKKTVKTDREPPTPCPPSVGQLGLTQRAVDTVAPCHRVNRCIRPECCHV